MYNWAYFNDNNYYPALNFHMLEYDRNPFKDLELKVTLKVGIKVVEGVELGVEGTLPLKFNDPGSDCGTTTLMYFENPVKRLYFNNYGAAIDISDQY